MKHGWFWSAGGAWVLLMVAVAGRALIVGDRQEVQELGRFSARVNGHVQRHEIWSSLNKQECFRPIQKTWVREGWVPVSGGLDLAAALLGLPQEETLLTSRMQTAVFRKNGVLRLLASVRSGDTTYVWKSEMPESAVGREGVKGRWDFPLRPPAEARQALCVASGRLCTAHWRQDLSCPSLSRLARSQGYDCRVCGAPKDGTTWVLTKGSKRILAAVTPKGDGSEVSLILF